MLTKDYYRYPRTNLSVPRQYFLIFFMSFQICIIAYYLSSLSLKMEFNGYNFNPIIFSFALILFVALISS